METFTPDNLIAGDFPVVTSEVTIATGQDLVRGSALGKLDSGGDYALCDIENSDGSEDIKAILAEDCDASDGAVEHVPVYLSGEFLESGVTFGGSTGVEDVRDAARDLGIYFKESVPA